VREDSSQERQTREASTAQETEVATPRGTKRSAEANSSRLAKVTNKAKQTVPGEPEAATVESSNDARSAKTAKKSDANGKPTLAKKTPMDAVAVRLAVAYWLVAKTQRNALARDI